MVDKFPILLGTAAVVFTGGVVLLVVPPVARRVKAAAATALDWLDGLIERLAVLGGARSDDLDWDAVAAGGAGCPECAGADRAQASRAELALLRTINKAGREETQTLRHQVAMLTDALTAADRVNAGLSAELIAAHREIELLRRERSMAAKPAANRNRRSPVPGAAMGDA